LLPQTQQESQNTQDAELPARLEFKQQDVDTASQKTQNIAALGKMRSLFKEHAWSDRRCQICERKFDKDKDIADFCTLQVRRHHSLGELPLSMIFVSGAPLVTDAFCICIEVCPCVHSNRPTPASRQHAFRPHQQVPPHQTLKRPVFSSRAVHPNNWARNQASCSAAGGGQPHRQRKRIQSNSGGLSAVQDTHNAQLPETLLALQRQEAAVRKQLVALRKLEPLHARVQQLGQELIPAARAKAEVLALPHLKHK